MTPVAELALGASLSYAAGCAVAGFYLTRWRLGVDVRRSGSRNAGARNTARLMGWRYGVVAAAWDFAKGASSVGVCGGFSGSELAAGTAAIAVVIGHVAPIQLRFRGGKGVAPAAGALAVLQPETLAIMAAAYILPVRATRCINWRAIMACGVAIGTLPFVTSSAVSAVSCVTVLAILVCTHAKSLIPAMNRPIEGRAEK